MTDRIGVDIVGAGTLDIRGAGFLHVGVWNIICVRPDGSAADELPPAELGSVPAGPPRNGARMYRELAQAISQTRPASPGFDAAVRYHELVDPAFT